MKFTWDESKRLKNLKKHGFDFVWCEQVFSGSSMTYEDDREAYCEARFNTTGFLDRQIVTICHTETPDEIHIISMRGATRHEIKEFSRYF